MDGYAPRRTAVNDATRATQAQEKLAETLCVRVMAFHSGMYENPVFTGQIAWRALLKGKELPTDILGSSGARAWMGPDHYCVSYFLRGRDLINVVLRGKSEEWAEAGVAGSQ